MVRPVRHQTCWFEVLDNDSREVLGHLELLWSPSTCLFQARGVPARVANTQALCMEGVRLATWFNLDTALLRSLAAALHAAAHVHRSND